MTPSQNGSVPPKSESVEAIVHEYVPPGETCPTLPAFHPESVKSYIRRLRREVN